MFCVARLAGGVRSVRALGTRLRPDGCEGGHRCNRGPSETDRRFRRKQVRLGAVRSAVSNVRGHCKLAVGSFKQTERSWDALEMMFVAVGKRDAGTGDKIDDGTRHEHFAGLR
jgi:hypothetical protein